MTIDDVEDIQKALTELGIAMVLGVEQWTLHQRRLYEKATSVLNQERERINALNNARVYESMAS